MFKCKNCGTTKLGQKLYKSVSELRDVDYILQIKYIKFVRSGDSVERDISYKTVKRSKGFEIVTEDSFCQNCLPDDVNPKVVGSVKKKQTIAVKKLRGSDKKSKGERYGKKEKKERR